MSEQPKQICILGGGFGGLYTALRLSQLPWENNQKPSIFLIDKSDRFLFSPLLYELITSEMQSWEIAPPFVELLADTSVNFHQGIVTGIDITNQQIQIDNRSNLAYDQLVITMGGQTPIIGIPGAKDHAIPFRTLKDAYKLGEKLRDLEQSNAEKIRVAVVGGGYSGIEIACKLADRLGERGRLRIIEKSDMILRNSPDHNRKAAQKALEKRFIWQDLETNVTEITADSISLEYKGEITTLPVDIVLWTVGSQTSDFIANLPLQHNAQKQLTINPFLQAIDHPNIYVLGDVADCQDITGQKVPATAQVAIQQSDYCAWNIWASLNKRPLLPFRYQALGEMLTLGIDDATLSGFGISLDGSAAHLIRRLIYLYRLPTLKHQLNVGLSWITQPILEMIQH
ncbi:NAD(P)/FAD-dependent oxidoreductase [Chroococcus sp. FPU101]|uniref:NAD(P)/FAD-dependent oxidoreductase n=1 Tax=Chroococcus sp. FPU101 TaxID=1974212 RepID=UPI001A9041A6|nr:NAD(P)/FAD-dependent oxidoreductase [Chroococcus sp. FPU101]GFE71694.1 FAD-dependent pyridine nucleotide-disulphide oxidoreductase [Chroococcus sp. FPU101]